jgi:hypothetical protein
MEFDHVTKRYLYPYRYIKMIPNFWNEREQRWSEYKMNHVAHRANSILQKPSPHSGMHWLRFSVRACNDSHPSIRAYMDTGGKRVRFVSFRNWFLRYCVIKWRHSVKMLTDLESAHQGLSFEILHDIVPSILKFDPGVHHFWPKH